MFATVKRSVRRSRLMAAGFIHYYRDAPPSGVWGGPFNGQVFRRRIFDALRDMNFAAILETGTYLGTSAEYFEATGLPVFTVEGNPKCCGRGKKLGREYIEPFIVHDDLSLFIPQLRAPKRLAPREAVQSLSGPLPDRSCWPCLSCDWPRPERQTVPSPCGLDA
jgi:hypothetical protein